MSACEASGKRARLNREVARLLGELVKLQECGGSLVHSLCGFSGLHLPTSPCLGSHCLGPHKSFSEWHFNGLGDVGKT